MAQINVSYSDNWWYQAKADLETLNIDLTLSEIKDLTKEMFIKG